MLHNFAYDKGAYT